MQKIKVRKDVVEQITSKLKTPENSIKKTKNDVFNTDFAENLQNSDLKQAKKQITSKLRANEKESVGVTKDGHTYDLDNPTEKFYYDLKTEFEKTENNDEIEKSAKNQLIKKLVHIHNSKGKDYFAERYVKVIEDKKKADIKRKTEIAARTKKYQSLVNMLKTYEDNLTDKEKKFVEKKKRTCKPKKGTYTNSINKKTYTGKYYISPYRQKIQKEEDFAIFLASMGFSVYLVPEPSTEGKKIDAIVNNVPVDFKKVGTGNWAIPNEYKDGMKKKNCKGVLMQVPTELSGYRYKNEYLDLKTFVGKNTRIENEPGVSKNGILALWIEDDDRFEVFDMKKIRAEHDSSAQGRAYNKSSIFNISQQNNLSSKNVTKSVFTDWPTELRKLCKEKGLDYDSVIQKYDSKTVRYIAEEQLGQDAENVIAYKAYKELNKSLTYSGHKLQGRTRLYGMDISIENKKGSYRSGTDKDGHKWRTYMNYDYGYIRGTVGVDKDHLDCVSPDTKILMSDYTEKCASDIKIGDELIGIKIETQRYHQRKQIITKVLNVKKGVDDMLDITLSNGVKLRTTKGHLHYYFQGNTRDKYWKRADELKIGDKLVMIFNHKDLEESEDYKKGYLYGAYTGDGCYSFDESKQVYCDIRKGVDFIDVIHRVKKYWNDLGLETVDMKIEKPRQTNSLLADGRRIVSKMDLAILSIRGINKIRFIKSIFEKNPNSFEWCRGYIAGLFDTDGCLNCRHEFQITQTKNQDEFMKFTIECINKLGYQAVKRYDDIKLHTDYMADNVTMEFTQLIKPILKKKRNFLGQTYRYEPLEITDIKPYKGDFVAIQTDEQTYIANGLVTHNCYIGPDKEAQKVYVIHQNDPVTHKYDEDKCMLCFSSAADAKKAYMKQYDRPGFYGSMTTMTIDQFKSFIFSKKGKMIHKSFDIQITDITENNKQQKLEQFNKALNAIADNRPFVIKHIPADGSQRYENLTVRLMDFDRSKIEKAVHKVAMSLDADVLASSKGESFVYESQKEITEKFYKKVTDSARAVYNFVISYFDLPDIRIISKAGELKHKGKILYNPETGLPIKESEWKKFVIELEKFLNRNYSGVGEKIVLSAESLGIILDRLSKTNSLEAIRKMPLSTLKAKRYDVDWISESIKNMKDQFGDVISRERQARIQIAMDSAAQRVTRVKDDMRNNIQQIIIDGIRDKQSKSVVAQNLFDKCASLNRDMQRIADSEVQMAANSAYCKEEVYNSKPDEKVYFKRFEMMDDNTCKQCKELNGTIVLWSDVPLPDEHIRDPYAKYAIWEGKNEGSCPIGIVHPYCRGSWIRYYPDIE